MFRIALSLLVFLSTIAPSLWGQDPLTLADRAALNEARYKAAEAALTFERLRPTIRQIQEAQSLAQAAVQRLQALEEELSKRYTGGEKILNPDLEWVAKPAPEPALESKEKP